MVDSFEMRREAETHFRRYAVVRAQQHKHCTA